MKNGILIVLLVTVLATIVSIIVIDFVTEPRGLLTQQAFTPLLYVVYTIHSNPTILVISVAASILAVCAGLLIRGDIAVENADHESNAAVPDMQAKASEQELRRKRESAKRAEEFRSAALAFAANAERARRRAQSAQARHENKPDSRSSRGSASSARKEPEVTGWWTVLGVERTASKREIRLKFLDKMRLYHPDFVPEGKGDNAMLRILNEAYKEGIGTVSK